MSDKQLELRANERKLRVETLMKAAELHLNRVTTLSNREWQTKILYWGSLLTSGAALISVSGKGNPGLTEAIDHWDFLIVLAYYLSATVYLFGFSGNMHQSLVTERNRYQIAQDTALQIIGNSLTQMSPTVLVYKKTSREISDDPSLVYKPISRRQIFSSGVWGVKVMSTALFITSIWAISQVNAHAQNVSFRHKTEVCSQYIKKNVVFDIAKTTYDCERVLGWQPLKSSEFLLRCAFMLCDVNPHPSLSRFGEYEWGTYLAFGAAIVFLITGLFAWVRSRGP